MSPKIRLMFAALFAAGLLAGCNSPTGIPNPGGNDEDDHDDPGDDDGKTTTFFYLADTPLVV